MKEMEKGLEIEKERKKLGKKCTHTHKLADTKINVFFECISEITHFAIQLWAIRSLLTMNLSILF